MSFTIPEREPAEILVGVTWKWLKSLPAYPAPTWTLTYTLARSGQSNINLTASDNGDERHLINIDEATTTGYVAGERHWQSYVTDGTDRHFVERGIMVLLPDFSAAAIDPRSHARVVLEALNAMLEGKATQDQMTITIGDHTLQQLTPSQILDWRTVYQRKVNLETNKFRRERGLKPKGRKIKVRFN